MFALLLLAAVATPIDPRITHPWSLSVIVNIPGKVAAHTEHYRNLEECQREERILFHEVGAIPQIVIVPCNYVGLT